MSVKTDAEISSGHQQDVLTCGFCQKNFLLSDIVKFIQHKVLACNKENYNYHCDPHDSDDGGTGSPGSSLPLGVVNIRRPSISAPIKKGINSGRIVCSPSPDDEPRCSTPKRLSEENAKDITEDSSRIKEEMECGTFEQDEEEQKKGVDAESNTTHSEPSNYVCSTCKHQLYSAWRLVQHVQNCHGIKIYVENSSSSSPEDSSSPIHNKTSNNYSSSSSHLSNSTSGYSNNVSANSSLPTSLAHPSSSARTPVPHPLSASPMSEHTLNSFGVGGLLRSMGESPRHHQYPHSSTPHSSHLGSNGSQFSRTSSHDHPFQMEHLAEQFRLNQHHGLGLAAAAAVAAAGGVSLPHSSFGSPGAERPAVNIPPPSRPRSIVPPPQLALSLEPQIDFYSQRLRQLAGTTSPGAANSSSLPSPKKMSPPYTSPNSGTPLGLITSPQTMNNNNNNSSMSNNNNICFESPSGTLEKELQRPKSPTNKIADLSSSTSPSKQEDFQLSYAMSTTSQEEKNKECEFCGKKFKYENNLQAHRRNHTGEKPFKCTVCDHACSQSAKLKKHMKIHDEDGDKEDREEGNNDNAEDGEEDEEEEEEDEEEEEEDEIEEEEPDMGEEEEDEEEEEEEEEDDEEDRNMDMRQEEGKEQDEDMGRDAPEDLTTKSTPPTPPTTIDEKSKTPFSTPRPTPTPTPQGKGPTSISLVGELMDKFGLNNIQQYSEAYKQALQDTRQLQIRRKDELFQNHKQALQDARQLQLGPKDDHYRSPIISENNNIGSKRHIMENGIMGKSVAAIRLREEFTKSFMSGQASLDMVGAPPGMFGPGSPFEMPFDSKRLKLDLDNAQHPLLGRNMMPGNSDNIYAGLWLPALASAQHNRDHNMFSGNPNENPLNMLSRSNKHPNHMMKRDSKPGPSASSLAAAAAAAALNLCLPNSHMKKESRRNDTCEFCGKVFKNCSNLTVHRRSHTGEKPYKCELCSYACAQSSKLTRHMKTHGRLGKDVYRCRFCEMPFSVPSTLEKHMRKCVVNQNMKMESHNIMQNMKMDNHNIIQNMKLDGHMMENMKLDNHNVIHNLKMDGHSMMAPSLVSSEEDSSVASTKDNT
ncbi:hypothetical protein M8J75_007604 [Diaphorina citri]|nr:hypothetical protein M8J75_007604 [Diaphorina citri]